MKTERHNFKVGDIVTVFNRSLGGRFVIEGRATIVKVRLSEDSYEVRFLGVKLASSQGKVVKGKQRSEGHTYLRYVDPNGQESPEGYLQTLNGI